MFRRPTGFPSSPPPPPAASRHSPLSSWTQGEPLPVLLLYRPDYDQRHHRLHPQRLLPRTPSLPLLLFCCLLFPLPPLGPKVLKKFVPAPCLSNLPAFPVLRSSSTLPQAATPVLYISLLLPTSPIFSSTHLSPSIAFRRLSSVYLPFSFLLSSPLFRSRSRFCASPISGFVPLPLPLPCLLHHNCQHRRCTVFHRRNYVF